MARPQSLSDRDMVAGLTSAFRRAGYEGTSLAELAAATGLAKAALYHRFPAGKAAMAEAVESAVGADFGDKVLAPLVGPGTPSERIRAMTRGLMMFYADGRHACLVEVFSIEATPEPVRRRLRAGVRKWIATLASVLMEAGLEATEAKRRAEDAVIRTQGALVVSRALGERRHFIDTVRSLPEHLLSPPATTS
ncbi:MAG TPA: TetR family transcriptional regulator [Bauldia sp.]|nr:TetR family transcriptional regulator [Bauldia sp.]